MLPITSSAAPAASRQGRLHLWTAVIVFALIFNVGRAGGGVQFGKTEDHQLTPRAYLLRYWEEHVAGGLPKSEFLMDKASPLTAAQYAEFLKVSDDPKALSERWPELCAQANLMCFPDSVENINPELLDVDFQNYNKGGPKKPEKPIYSGTKFRRYNEYHKDADGNNRLPRGIFFREAALKSGAPVVMPDFIDRKPIRSFLPRRIISKLPFSSDKISDIKFIFHAQVDSSKSKMFTEAIEDCERAPNRGETKRCVASIEDMIDFTTIVLGRDVVVRTIDGAAGSNATVLLGNVRGINGGRVTKSVSCHQTLYPYLLYYCHSVNGIRVYESDLLDLKTKAKINHGVAVCHEDTSSWSSNHPAFAALGSAPGEIEVCHWIFQNDLTWVVAD